MFSSSDVPDDIVMAHDAGANSFICKPLTANGLRDVIRQIRERWLALGATPCRLAFRGVHVSPKEIE